MSRPLCLCAQADGLHAEAEVKRGAGDMQAAQDLESAALASQKQAIELTRSAEASWAEASKLGNAASRIALAAGAAQRKAARLTDAGKLASEAQAAVDAISEHLASAAQEIEAAQAAERGSADKDAVRTPRRMHEAPKRSTRKA